MKTVKTVKEAKLELLDFFRGLGVSHASVRGAQVRYGSSEENLRPHGM